MKLQKAKEKCQKDLDSLDIVKNADFQDGVSDATEFLGNYIKVIEDSNAEMLEALKKSTWVLIDNVISDNNQKQIDNNYVLIEKNTGNPIEEVI